MTKSLSRANYTYGHEIRVGSIPTTLGFCFLGFSQGTHDTHRVSLVILARFKLSLNCAIFAPPAIARIITPNTIVCIVLNDMHSHDLSQSQQVDSLDTAFFQALIKIYTRKLVTVVPLLKVTLPSYLQRDNECFRIID